jgi:hypothetical protein
MHTVSVLQLQVFKSLWVSENQNQCFPLFLKIFSPVLASADYIVLLQAPSYILKGLCFLEKKWENGFKIFRDEYWVCSHLRRENDELVSIYINWGQSIITWKRIFIQKQRFVSLKKTLNYLRFTLKAKYNW